MERVEVVIVIKAGGRKPPFLKYRVMVRTRCIASLLLINGTIISR